MDEDIHNRTGTFCTVIPLALGEEKSGELRSTNHRDLVVKSYPPKSTFLENHTSAKFSHALGNDLSHPPSRTGPPLQLLSKGKSKIGLEFDIFPPVTFGDKGTTSMKHCHRCRSISPNPISPNRSPSWVYCRAPTEIELRLGLALELGLGLG